jgi:hypothetical protein
MCRTAIVGLVTLNGLNNLRGMQYKWKAIAGWGLLPKSLSQKRDALSRSFFMSIALAFDGSL